MTHIISTHFINQSKSYIRPCLHFRGWEFIICLCRVVPYRRVPNTEEQQFNLPLPLREKTQFSSKHNNELKLQISESCHIVPIPSLNKVPLKLETCKLNTHYMSHVLASPHTHTVGVGIDHPTVQISLRNETKWRDTAASGL